MHRMQRRRGWSVLGAACALLATACLDPQVSDDVPPRGSRRPYRIHVFDDTEDSVVVMFGDTAFELKVGQQILK